MEVAASRAHEFGANRLPTVPPRSAWRVLAGQFSSVLVLVLLGAAVLSAAIGNQKDAIVIACVVIVNALFGFYQEYRAEQSLDGPEAHAPRACARTARGHHPGDSCRRTRSGRRGSRRGGRPCPGRRSPHPRRQPRDRRIGTDRRVRAGRQDHGAAAGHAAGRRRPHQPCLHEHPASPAAAANCVVTATGPRTEIGRLSQQLALATEPPSPLQVQLDQLGKRLGALAVTLVSLLAFLEWLRGTDLAHLLIDAIALAVAAVPEGLPVVVTVTLALGMQRMARAARDRQAPGECRDPRLHDGDLLGQDRDAHVEPDDGAGLLLRRSIRRSVDDGERHELRARATTAEPDVTRRCCRAGDGLQRQPHRRDPRHRRSHGRRVAGARCKARHCPQRWWTRTCRDLHEVPFDSAHKFMATFHRQGDQVVAVREGRARCAAGALLVGAAGGRGTAARRNRRGQIDETYHRYGDNGLRGLLVASRALRLATSKPPATSRGTSRI